MSRTRPIALLDRDGTIIFNRHYLSDPEGVELIPRAAEGLRRMRELGWDLVLITNQSGIGRGYFTEERLTEIHDRFTAMLAAEQIQLDGIFFCPHTPDDNCACRKPGTGMVDQAARELDFDLARAVMIGDSHVDMGLARNLGVPGLFIPGADGPPPGLEADHVVKDLVEAASIMEEIGKNW